MYDKTVMIDLKNETVLKANKTRIKLELYFCSKTADN